jgi:hypothetical protein
MVTVYLALGWQPLTDAALLSVSTGELHRWGVPNSGPLKSLSTESREDVLTPYNGELVELTMWY